MILVMRSERLTHNSSSPNSKMWQCWVLGICNTCARLQSRNTISGATVNRWLIFFPFFCRFIFYYGCWPIDGCLFLFGFFWKRCILFLFWPFLFFPFLEGSAILISMWSGEGLILCWLEKNFLFWSCALILIVNG